MRLKQCLKLEIESKLRLPLLSILMHSKDKLMLHVNIAFIHGRKEGVLYITDV